jgi:ABC-type antimicrobial peptide transport system permease subunit
MKIKINFRNINIKTIGNFFATIGLSLWSNTIFTVLLLLYVIRRTVYKLLSYKYIGSFFKKIKFNLLLLGIEKLMAIIDGDTTEKMSKVYLIELSFKNLKSKKNRTIVTIGGMAVGVGAIVFLVSLGYGLERLVISRVARLDELKMADINSKDSLSLQINDELIKRIEGQEGIDKVVPMITMVSKVRFNNSIFDTMSYGVDSRYVNAVNPKKITGDDFKDKDLSFSFDDAGDDIQGTDQKVVIVSGLGQKVDKLVFSFNVVDKKTVPVYENAMSDSKVIGYVVRSDIGYMGEEIWGHKYKDDQIVAKDVSGETEYSKWIRAKVPIWNIASGGLAVPITDNEGVQKWTIGFIRIDTEMIDHTRKAAVDYEKLDDYLNQGSALVGEVDASSSASVFSETVKDDSGVEWVEYKQVTEDINKVQELKFKGKVSGDAYVSTGMLKMFGLSGDKAIDREFMVSYIVPDSVIPDKTGRLQSEEVVYLIKGVFEDDKSAYYYYNIADTKRLGIKNYSQLKVIAKTPNSLNENRKYIASLGYKTISTVDTVSEINKLFNTLRLLLGFLGTVALVVASLGMFNTMTVSLLERTREVGVMKAVGMLSNEVRELFLAESMIMGIGGGAFGILFGYLLGRLLSLFLSSVSILKGQGFIDISYVPWFFVIFILSVSYVVGLLTGWYPSRRARKLSALNALRYE